MAFPRSTSIWRLPIFAPPPMCCVQFTTQTHGRDGYISLECSPYLANDTEATVAEALRLWAAVQRPNLMVKVPATPAGIPAIRQLTGRGLNINITLLFSVTVYEQVVEAYISGLEDLKRAGGDISKVGSVASIFVSRIDVAIDKRLDKLGDKRVADRLRGKAAIANAKLAYVRYKAQFSGPRWQSLAVAGAKTQRLLWASTSTKSPAYKDTMYVEALIGRDTVDTIPPATMDAFREHGKATPDVIEQDIAGARAVLAELERRGISLKEVTDELVTEGVQQFADSFDKLFGAIARQRRALLEGDRASMEIGLGSPEMKAAFDAEMEVWRAGGRIRRLWAGDTSLWAGTDEDKWLGWLNIVEQELADIDRLTAFAKDVKQGGFTDLVLLGMGGSSLGPEVFGKTFGQQANWPRFHMLDSTDPAQIKAIEQAVDIGKTLFIVSSKSGSTLEPNIFMDYFHDRVCAVRGKDKAGEHFVAVTDPGSSLERRAKQLGFAHIFYGVASIGGRYSVLSKFGLVPAAAMGLDVKRLLETVRPMQRACGADVPPAENPGVQLGIAMGIAATRFGRDKVTIIASPGIADLGAWLEQLLAESTGKHGRGLIPLADEPFATPERYGKDRFFAYLELEGQHDPSQRQAMATLEQAGHPVARISVKDIWHIGQEFFRWEIATAVAGAIIGIDPFNQPDVEASKEQDARADRRLREVTSLAGRDAGIPRERAGSLCRPAQCRRARPAQHVDRLSEEPFRPRACRRKVGRLRGAAGLHRAQRGAHAGFDRDARAYSRQDPSRYLSRLRAPLPAFDRASLQRRAEFRSVPADHLRRSGGYRRTRPFLQLWRREGSAGQRRSRGAGGARSSRVAYPPQRCRCGFGGACPRNGFSARIGRFCR